MTAGVQIGAVAKSRRKEQEMAIEKRYSLSAAAKLAGIGRDALRRWLEIDLGIKNQPRGARVLLTESQINYVLARRTAKVRVI
jgi:hypothetical protein